MAELRFEWDETKAVANQNRHSVSFEEAKTVFADELVRLIPDPDHSIGKERFILLGMSRNFRLLVVSHCERNSDVFVLFRPGRPTGKNVANTRISSMREHYDFSNSKPNPYAKQMKKQVTIRLDEDTVSYFKEMAEAKGIPYQSLINLYLRDCAASHRELKLHWS